MLGLVKEVTETIRDWREHRELLYQLFATLSAILVVIAVATGTRPSDALSVFARSLGATPVADWFGTGAPPMLAASNATVQFLALSAVLLVLAGMVVVPLWRARHADNDMFGYESLRLLWSPASSSIWICLVVAAQQGDISPTIQQWERNALLVVTWTLAAALVAGLLYFVARRHGFSDPIRPLVRVAATMLCRACFGLCATLLAVSLAAVSLPLSIIGWAFALESDRSRARRHESESAAAERPLASGAPVMPLRTA